MAKLTNFKVMLIRQRIIHRFDLWHSSQNGIGHSVHHRLHAGTIHLGEGVERNLACRAPGIVESRCICLYIGEAGEIPPFPCSIYLGAEDSVPDLGQSRILVAHKAPELRASALQYVQALDARGDCDALALRHIHLHIASFCAIPEEGVRMRLAVDGHASPSVGDDVDMSDVDVAVFLDEVGTNN